MSSSSRTRRLLAAAAAGCSVFAATAHASAANCSASSLPGTVVYGAVGTSQVPLVQSVAQQLAVASSPVTVVYLAAAACTDYGYLANGVNATPTASWWDAAAIASGKANSCTLDVPVTFAVMGNSPALCAGVTWPSDTIGQFLGPAQTLDFVVPTGSPQQSISTEAAYYVWGFFASDANHTVRTWNTPANILTRSSTSFISVFLALDLSLALNVNVSPAVVSGAGAPDGGTFGTSASTTQLTVADLAKLDGTSAGSDGTGGAQSGIGLVSGETADGSRGLVNILAYQHTGQSCGYWPDSTPNAYDKVNVRSGQYWLWTPIHFFAAIGDGGQISDPNTAALVGYFTGTTAPPAGVDLFTAEVAEAFTIPQCAMQAWRDGDLSAPYSYAPPVPCTCKFDIATNNTATRADSCKACTQDTDCSTGHCRNIGAPVSPLQADGGTSSIDAGAASVGYCEVY